MAFAESWVKKHPGALRAFWARWREVWTKRRAGGAFAEDEEEEQRKALLHEVTGKTSTRALDQAEFNAVMLAMGSELFPDGADPRTVDPVRLSKIRAIQHREPSDEYLDAIVARTNPGADGWRSLPAAELHKLLLTLVMRDRRAQKKGG